MKVLLTDSDIEAFNCSASASEKFQKDFTREQIQEFLDENPGIAAIGIQWGWHDTEAREQLCEKLFGK